MSSSSANALKVLIRQVASGERDAFADLYNRTSAKLFSVTLGISGSKAQAEEILQEVYVTVWQKAGRFDPDKGAVMTWLITIARNRALSAKRKTVREWPADEADIESMLGAGDGRPGSEAADQGLRHDLEACLGELEGKQERAIRLAYVLGYTHEELAEQLDCPLGTVKSWIRRGLAKLKTCLDYD